MPAPKGNQFWKIAHANGNLGRPLKIETPEELWTKATEFMNWCDAHPWFKVEAIKSGDSAGKLIKIPTQRPYTLTGFCAYIGASEEWWRNFKKPEKEEFLGVIDAIEQIFYTQKFEGAAVGAFNANIISRDLGLADKSEQTNTVKVINVNLTDGDDD